MRVGRGKPSIEPRLYERMDTRLKRLAGDRIRKDNWRQPATLIGGNQFMYDVIRIQSLNAKFPEELGEQAFAAGD